MRPKLSYANVMATIAVFIALGGSAFAFHLGKNSVGPRQLKKNAITTAKVKDEAITAAKVKKGSLTGGQINVSTLGTVPAARTSDSSITAQTANSVAPPEPWHQVGTPGEPPFEKGWKNIPQEGSSHAPTVAFYKDHEGVVHLRGVAFGGETKAFRLPTGYRPGPNIELVLPGVTIYGSGISSAIDGLVFAEGIVLNLNGITFRAES
jgi:hypothetical protein